MATISPTATFDYCNLAGGGLPAAGHGNDDLIKATLRAVMMDNATCVFLVSLVILAAVLVVYYLVRSMVAVYVEYRTLRAAQAAQLSALEDYADESAWIADEEDAEDAAYGEAPRLPEVPQVRAVRNRLGQLEAKYRDYNLAVSARRDGAEAVMDAGIVARRADNYTYAKGTPQPRLRV